MIEKKDEARTRAHRRWLMWLTGLLTIAILITLLVVFSSANIQDRWLPAWVIANWSKLVVGGLVFAFALLLLLPVYIEANLNPSQWGSAIRRRVGRKHRKPSPYDNY